MCFILMNSQEEIDWFTQLKIRVSWDKTTIYYDKDKEKKNLKYEYFSPLNVNVSKIQYKGENNCFMYS